MAFRKTGIDKSTCSSSNVSSFKMPLRYGPHLSASLGNSCLDLIGSSEVYGGRESKMSSPSGISTAETNSCEPELTDDLGEVDFFDSSLSKIVLIFAIVFACHAVSSL